MIENDGAIDRKERRMENSRKTSSWILYLLLAVSAAACVWKWGISGRALVTYVFLAFLSGAAWKDIRSRHIPDYIVLGAGLAGVLSVPFFPETGIADRGIGILCVSLLLLMISFVRPGSFGGGDIKLMAAGGMFLGWERNVLAFALAVFLAGAYCIWMLLQGKLNLKAQIALGPFLCAGIVIEVFM